MQTEPMYPIPALFPDAFAQLREAPKRTTEDVVPAKPDREESNVSDLDRHLNYLVARATAGLSPAACANAFFDWGFHLAASPGLRLNLFGRAVHNWMRLSHFAQSAALGNPRPELAIEPKAQDKRFTSEHWGDFPFNVFAQAFLLNEAS